MDNIIARRVELALKSMNGSSGQDVATFTANSELREQVGISAPFWTHSIEKLFSRNWMLLIRLDGITLAR